MMSVHAEIALVQHCKLHGMVTLNRGVALSFLPTLDCHARQRYSLHSPLDVCTRSANLVVKTLQVH